MRLLFTALFSLICFQGFTHSNFLILKTDSTKKNAKNNKKEMVFPEPGNVNKLFYIQRDPNTNTLIYELNTNKSGELDKENPVHVYWIRYADKGQKEELNYIQRKFAYGITARQTKADEYDLRFVSYKKLPLSLSKGTDGKYHIYATIEKKQAILNRIFVRIEGGSFWLPNIVYAELKGADPATGKEMVERFKP